MISTAFEYSRATSLDDALAKLRATNGEGKFIAGGHSLVPLMKLRLSEPKTLIDIARIPGLSGINRHGDNIQIGAGTVHHDVATSALLRQACPMLSDAAAAIGDPQVRNRGTLGGSLAHADPSADYPAAMLALDADIHVKGPTGSRVGEGARFLPRSVHRRSGRGRDHRRRGVPSGEDRRLREAVSARVALCDRRRGGRAGREERDDSVGANRA